MRAKQRKRGLVILATAWLVSLVVSPCRSFCSQKPRARHGVGPLLAAQNKDPQGIKPVEESADEVDALTLARRQLKLALDQQASAQKQVDSAQKQVNMALEDLRKAKQKGDEQKVEKAEAKVAKAKVEKAKEEVEKAKAKVEKAKEEVEKAKEEVKEAKKEVNEAKEEMKAQQEKACIKAAMQKGLKYCDPCPLLATPGATWDYYGGEELRQFMKPGLMTLCENKGKNADKKMHPIFLALAAPGQGKSRFLQEFHNLAEEAAVLNATKYGKRFFQFSLTLENGQKYDNAFDSNPQTLLASRMIWQLLNENGPKKQTWATLAGLPPNFTFKDLRSRVYAESICFDDVIRALQEGEELEEGEWSLSLAVDGLHNLPGSENMSNKETPFYTTLQEICEFVNRQEGPLVVAAVSATVQVSIEAALADSPQSRIFIQLPLVDVVQRGGEPVFNFSGNRLLELVEQDMGGHGRALEALETAINGYNEHCWNAEVLMSTVRVRLRDAYPGAIASSDVIEPVLKAALSGRWLTPNENIGGQNVEKMQLVQLQYNKERTHRRLLMPYIWIHLAVTKCPSLQHWALMDYTAIGKGPDPGGHDFEDFLVNFRALKSLAWNDGEKVGLSDLHAGACLQPSNLKGVQVINRHLEVVTAQGWTATNSNDFGRIKGQNGTVRQRWQKASKQRGAEIELNSSRYSCIVLNATGAPAADFVSLLQKVEGAPLSECGQAKQGDAPLSKKIIQDERSKSCVGDDLLMLFCSKDKGFGKEDLPRMTGIVQPAQWPQYFGPYVGRAWVAAKVEITGGGGGGGSADISPSTPLTTSYLTA